MGGSVIAGREIGHELIPTLFRHLEFALIFYA
jgi:hypothetical protein